VQHPGRDVGRRMVVVGRIAVERELNGGQITVNFQSNQSRIIVVTITELVYFPETTLG